MFRIRKIFENRLTTILRIEGTINNTNLAALRKEMSALLLRTENQVILDGSGLAFVTPKVAELFNELLLEEIYLLNFPVNLRNMLGSLGWSDRLLE